MTSRTVIDGNAFYEIDEECMKLKRRQTDSARKDAPGEQKQTGDGLESENVSRKGSGLAKHQTL